VTWASCLSEAECMQFALLSTSNRVNIHSAQQKSTEKNKKVKTIPVTGRGGPLCCDTSSLLHFLDNRLTDGGEVVSLKHRPAFTPRKIPSTHFYQRLSRHQGHSAAGRIRSIEKSNDLIENGTRDLPACSIITLPLALPGRQDANM
jgi:hypothetical protein